MGGASAPIRQLDSLWRVWERGSVSVFPLSLRAPFPIDGTLPLLVKSMIRGTRAISWVSDGLYVLS